MPIMQNKLIRVIALAVLAYAPYGFSGDLAVDLFTEAEFSNNITRASSGRLSDVEQSSGLVVNYLEESRNIQADANFRLEAQNYYENTYEDELSLTTGFGVVSFNLVDDLLAWQTSYDRDELLVGAGAEDTPDNREYRGVLRTGPRVEYRFSPSSTLGLRSSYVRAQNSGDFLSDSERTESALDYIYQWNSITALRFSSGYEDLFEIENDRTYKRYSADVGAVRQVSNGLLSVTLGRTYLKPKVGSGLSENHIDIEYRRQDFLLHDLALSYSRNLSDSSVGAPIADSPESVRVAREDSTLLREEFEFSLERDFGGSRYIVAPYWSSENYANATNAEERFGASFRYDLEVNPFLLTGLMTSYEQTDFGKGTVSRRFGVDEIYTYELNASYGLSSRLMLSSALRFEHQTNKYVLARKYDEISLSLGLNWQLFE